MTDEETDGTESTVDGSADGSAAPVAPLASPLGFVDTLSPASLAPAELAPGTRLGRFCIEARLGAGAMGVVYTARDEQLGRRVAVKLVTGPTGDVATTRFLREAQVMARLAHPNVAHIYEAGAVDGRLFIAMELVEGETVAGWLGRPHPWREVLALFLAAGRGLAAAHAAGIVHRDFKPANVLVGDGRARVVDFGLASVSSDRDEDLVSGESPVAGAETLTQTGVVLGTPAYMAPEQRAGARATAASDQYSYCVALWEALAGVRPGPDAEGAAHRPPRVVARVIARGLAADPGARWPDMDALLDALERAARARRVVGGAAAMALAAGVAGTVALFHGAPANACELGRERLAGVWDGGRKAAMHRAFAATNQPFAEKQWQTVEALVDRYTDDWVTRSDAACAAERTGDTPRAQLDGRRVCLDRHLDHLHMWLDVFGKPDAALVQDAGRAAAGLEDLAVCDDPAYIADVRPADPALAAVTEGLTKRLDAGEMVSQYQDYARGVAELRAVLEAAKQVGYQPLIVESLEGLAYTQQTASEFKDSIPTWLEIRDRAEATHQDLSRARAWAGLAFAYGNLSEFAQAHDAARVAAAIVQPLTTYEARVVKSALDEDEANTYWGEGNLDKAYELMQKVDRDQHALHLNDDPFRVAGAEATMGGLLTSMGRYDEAQRYLESARKHFLDVNGDRHPAVASIVNNLGNVLFFKGDYEHAAASYREALAIRDAAGIPETNTGRGYNWLNLGEALVHLGRADEAAAALARARVILSAQLGEDNAYFAELLAWTGLAELARNRAADAVAPLERSVAEYRAHKETAPADLALAELGLARALWEAQPAAHDRARELATSAADRYAGAKDDAHAAEARAWLAAHAK